MQILKPEDFYKKSCKTIYENMVALFDDNKEIDYVTIIEKLKKNKKLKDVGEAFYITNLTKNVPSAHNVEYYSNLVKEKSTLREI